MNISISPWRSATTALSASLLALALAGCAKEPEGDRKLATSMAVNSVIPAIFDADKRTRRWNAHKAEMAQAQNTMAQEDAEEENDNDFSYGDPTSSGSGDEDDGDSQRNGQSGQYAGTPDLSPQPADDNGGGSNMGGAFSGGSDGGPPATLPPPVARNN